MTLTESSQEADSGHDTKDSRVRVLAHEINGHLYPYIFDVPCIKEALALEIKPKDIILGGYPKSGTTWLRYVIWSIRHLGAPLPRREDLEIEAPLIEREGVSDLVKAGTERQISSHFIFSQFQYHPEAKYVFIARNPADMAVSLYYFSIEGTCGRGYEATFDDLFEQLVAGELPYGDYFDHFFGWFKQMDRPNVLFLFYEEMLADTPGTVLKIARFLSSDQRDYLRLLTEDNSAVLDKVIANTKFASMKEIPYVIQDETKADVKINFWRKGTKGDWKSHFSPEKMDTLTRLMERKIKEWDVDQARFGKIWDSWFN